MTQNFNIYKLAKADRAVLSAHYAITVAMQDIQDWANEHAEDQTPYPADRAAKLDSLKKNFENAVAQRSAARNDVELPLDRVIMQEIRVNLCRQLYSYKKNVPQMTATIMDIYGYDEDTAGFIAQTTIQNFSRLVGDLQISDISSDLGNYFWGI